MRIIHTADWHLGNKMHNVDRREEFKSFLCWLKDQIFAKEAEVLVIAGDVFDVPNPPTDARTQYIDFLASISNSNCKNIIIIGGNHDSGALLDSEKSLFEQLNIHVVGSAANLMPEDMVFDLKGKDGELIGVCAAVPYVHEIELRKYYDEESEPGTFGDNSYKILYEKVLEVAEKHRGSKEVPLITTGHLYAANLEGRFTGAEKDTRADDGRRTLDVVGNLGSIHAGTFPSEFDYVALGHIHYSTMVAKNPKIRYSGSPFILGFDEHNLKHCVLSVDVKKGVEPEVEKIEVPETVLYKRITGTASQIQEQVESLINRPPKLEVNLEINYIWEDGININDVVEKLNDRLPENISIVHKKRCEEQDVSGSSFDLYEDVDVEDLTFDEIFKGLILEKCPVDKTNLSDEEIKGKQEKIIEKYLPLLSGVIEEYEQGVRYEDK